MCCIIDLKRDSSKELWYKNKRYTGFKIVALYHDLGNWKYVVILKRISNSCELANKDKIK